MREMTESTYNAIKNRTMTGNNTFRQEVLIEDEPLGWSDFESPSAILMSDQSNYVDYCELSNGKILTASIRGLGIYLKTVDDITQTLSANDGDLFLTLNGVTDNSCFSLLKLNSGKILLIVTDIGVYGGAQFSTTAYISQAGDGSDFIPVDTIFSKDRTASSTFICRGYISKPVQTTNGDIYFQGQEIVRDGSYDASNLAVYKSTDGGYSWSRVYYLALMGRERYLHSKSMVQHGDSIFCPIMYSYAGAWPKILISENNGQTWSFNQSRFANFPKYGGWENISQVDYATTGNELYMIREIDDRSTALKLYKFADKIASYANLADWANWQEVQSGFVGYYSNFGRLSNIGGSVVWAFDTGITNRFGINISKREFVPSNFKALSISIAKSIGGANTASIKADNKNGVVNPRSTSSPLYGILNLNKQVIIRQGYGDDLVDSFTGMIDGIHMSTFPQVADVKLRDNLKRALDQTVTKDGSQVVFYPHQPIENIVLDLCGLCGLPIGLIEPTGINIEKEFNWQTYADAIQFLSDIASFEFLVDESGLFYFRRDYQPNDMTIAWSFEEGVDIQDLSYDIDDTDIYKSVRVYGKSGDNILVYNAPFLDAEEFNILPQKIMKIDATEASTTTELRKIAERAVATMRSRTRVISFTAIAIPHLQVGDFIQLFESSTNTHEIYRLSAINLTMTKDSFTMSCTGYYYGDSIVPGDLPEDVATQTPDPALNLIPNMTSNTKPSGVASSSSTYLLYGVRYSPWRAFNNDDTDYFWDLSTKTGWIAYEFPEKTIVDKYVIKARQDLIWNKALPKDWKFEAFDGATWITLDTRTGETDWGIYEERSFIFNNTTPYAKYRLKVSANNGYVRTQIEQLSMYYGGGL